jgi:hypothetical protein
MARSESMLVPQMKAALWECLWLRLENKMEERDQTNFGEQAGRKALVNGGLKLDIFSLTRRKRASILKPKLTAKLRAVDFAVPRLKEYSYMIGTNAKLQ